MGRRFLFLTLCPTGSVCGLSAPGLPCLVFVYDYYLIISGAHLWSKKSHVRIKTRRCDWSLLRKYGSIFLTNYRLQKWQQMDITYSNGVPWSVVLALKVCRNCKCATFQTSVSLQRFFIEPLFVFGDPKYISVFLRAHLSKSFESTWPHSSTSQRLYLWLLAIWSCIILLIIWLLIKHINHSSLDIYFNDFLASGSELRAPGKKEFHRIETTDTPDATMHIYHLLYHFS